MADKQKAGSILRLLNFFNSFSFLSFFILSRSFICFVFLFFLLAYLFCFLLCLHTHASVDGGDFYI